MKLITALSAMLATATAPATQPGPKLTPMALPSIQVLQLINKGETAMLATIVCEFGLAISEHANGTQSIAHTTTTVRMPAQSETEAHVVVMVPGGKCEVTHMIQSLDV